MSPFLYFITQTFFSTKKRFLADLRERLLLNLGLHHFLSSSLLPDFDHHSSTFLYVFRLHRIS